MTEQVAISQDGQHAYTFRSHAGSERHEQVDPDNPLLRIPISHIREPIP